MHILGFCNSSYLSLITSVIRLLHSAPDWHRQQETPLALSVLVARLKYG